MKTVIQKIDAPKEKPPLKEVELMITVDEMELFAAYCLRHEIKFNDWIRQLAHAALENEHIAYRT